MRKPRKQNGFLLCFLMNLVLNLEWSIPAWILLALHFWLEISIWWFAGALALWLGLMLGQTLVIKWANNSSEPPKPQENKNPYSVGQNSPRFSEKKLTTTEQDDKIKYAKEDIQ